MGPPPLERHFFEVLREVQRGGGGGGACYKNDGPLLFGLKSMNLLSMVLFDFDLKKCFWIPTWWGLYGAEWDER